MSPIVVPLYPAGAKGFESRRNEAELAKDYWIRNIHNPSLTVYLPSSTSSTSPTAAIVIAPGGGHRELVFNAEGHDPAIFFNKLGVAAFVLKYRLAKEDGTPYTVDDHVAEDANRAMRLVRSRAQEWGVDPSRIGMMGFSAGAEVVAKVAYTSNDVDSQSPDPIDHFTSRPCFQILIYPVPWSMPSVLPDTAPPVFILTANDDEYGCADPAVSLMQMYRKAKLPVEMHLYARGKHAFNMGYRSQLKSIRAWPQRLAEWMEDNNILDPEMPKDF